MAEFKEQITITVQLLEIEQKPHLFKVVIAEKIERLKFLADIAVKFLTYKQEIKYFELNNLKKAEKIYIRI